MTEDTPTAIAAIAESQVPQVQVHCQVDLSLLGLLRDFVCNASRHFGFREDAIAEIELSVDEACANVAEHAYQCGSNPLPGSAILVEVTFAEPQLMVRVSDYGCGTPIDNLGAQNLESYLEEERDNYRGLGIIMMKKFMDHVDIRSGNPSGTVVTMIKMRR